MFEFAVFQVVSMWKSCNKFNNFRIDKKLVLSQNYFRKRGKTAFNPKIKSYNLLRKTTQIHFRKNTFSQHLLVQTAMETVVK